MDRANWNRRIGARLGLLAAVITAGIGMTATVSAGASAAATKAPPKPDLAYFAGKTITWIVPQAPGGSYYTNAQILAPLMGQYLHATINLVSQPAGNTVVGQNQTATAAPDGLTIGTLALNTDIVDDVTNVPNLQVPLRTVGIIGGIHQSPSILVACTGFTNTYTSWKQVVKDKPTVNVVSTTGSVQEHLALELDGYGIHASLLTAYATATTDVAGCLRGDGAFTQEADSNYTPAEFTSGQLRPLLMSAPELPSSSFYAVTKGVPVLTNYLKQNPPKSAQAKRAEQAIVDQFGGASPNQVVFDPPHTPVQYTEALQKAMRSADAQAQVITALETAGSTPGYITPTTVLDDFDQLTGSKTDSDIRYYLSLPQNQ